MSQLGQQRSHLASVLGGVKDYMTQYVFQQYTEVAGCGEVASRERISQFLSALKLWTAKPCRECQNKGRSRHTPPSGEQPGWGRHASRPICCSCTSSLSVKSASLPSFLWRRSATVNHRRPWLSLGIPQVGGQNAALIPFILKGRHRLQDRAWNCRSAADAQAGQATDGRSATARKLLPALALFRASEDLCR